MNEALYRDAYERAYPGHQGAREPELDETRIPEEADHGS